MESNLPAINATFNLISTVLLMFGYVNIRKGNKLVHRRFMIGALISSTLFLICYVIYHYSAGSIPYPHNDWTRPLYFTILIPHVILAALMGPFIVVMVTHAILGNFEKHKRLARFVWPVWIFVSLTGVIIFYMLYIR